MIRSITYHIPRSPRFPVLRCNFLAISPSGAAHAGEVKDGWAPGREKVCWAVFVGVKAAQDRSDGQDLDGNASGPVEKKRIP